jgi:hypothetical protein
MGVAVGDVLQWPGLVRDNSSGIMCNALRTDHQLENHASAYEPECFASCDGRALHIRTLLIFRSRQCIIAQATIKRKTSNPWMLVFGVRPLLRGGGLCLAERSQAASADPCLAGLALLIDGRLLNVHFKLAFGVPHRVADVVPKLRAPATDLTFCHWISASRKSISNKSKVAANP